MTEWSSTKRSSLKLLPPRELLSRARDHSQRIYPSGHLSIYPPHIYPPFIYPLPPTTYPSDHDHTIQEYSSLSHFPDRPSCSAVCSCGKESLSRWWLYIRATPLLEHNLEAKRAMPCHVSSQCVQYCCRSKRRHKHRPVSIGLSVSRRDFIRNLSTGISIRNQGSSRICAEIFAATFAVDFLSRGRNRQMWISAHTDRASGGIAPEIQKVFQWKVC